MSQTFPSNIGMRQECILMHTLFNIFINDLQQELNSKQICNDLHHRNICHLLFADDLVLFAVRPHKPPIPT